MPNKTKYHFDVKARIFFVLILFMPFTLKAQELEPRNLVNIPVGTNFIVGGYGYGRGNILLDPSIPLDNFEGSLHTFAAAYLRSINFFGLSGKVDIVLPFGTGDWNYSLEGQEESDYANGFGDMRVRLSVNFLGAPALNFKEYADYMQKTVMGCNIQSIVPTGSYKSSQLPNLGSNRWAFKNQFGISHSMNKWIMEAYLALWLFTPNTNYLNGNELAQNPFLGIKTDIIRVFKKGMWLSADFGYGVGGTSKVNGVDLKTHISTLRFGLTYALPVAENHSLKFTAVSGVRLERGADFDAFGIAWQYRWFHSN